MRFYKYEDFDLGDGVYHKSNPRHRMIVIKKNDETKELNCRWINNEGNKIEDIFLFAELVKSEDHDRDMRPRIINALP